ncbi:MAG: ParA family protein [Methylococcales bacterium]
MKILALYSIKGGVGKTAAAVNLSYLAACDSARTLVWDLDVQASLSFYFRTKARIRGGGKGLIGGKSDLDDLIKGSDFDNLDLLPSDFSFRNLDLYLDGRKNPINRIAKILKPLAEQYDYVFLDCPPNLSLLSESVFGAAHALISPIIPTTLSVRTFQQLQKYIQKHSDCRVELLPFFSMVDLRKKLHRDVIETLSRDFPTLLNTKIPYSSEIEQMGIFRAPLAQHAPNSRSAIAFRELWAEIKQRIGDS